MTITHTTQTTFLKGLQKITRAGLQWPVTRHRTWQLVNYLRRRYSQHVPSVELITQYEGGIRINTSLSSHIEAQIFWQGFQEADAGTIKALKNHLVPNSVFIDVGANVGTFTLVAAANACRGTVHAFEPSQYHFERLKRNIDLNGFSNVVTSRVGLWDAPSSSTLHVPLHDAGMSNTGAASMFASTDNPESSTDETIQLIRLDDYVAQNALERIDIIKVDIEGAELPALRGAQETIRRFHPLVLMELDLDNLQRAGYTAADILAFWNDCGYRVRRILNSGDCSDFSDTANLPRHQNVQCEFIP